MTLLGDAGVPPVVEVGIGVTWGGAPLWYTFLDPEGLWFTKTLLRTTWSRRCVQDGVLLVSCVGWQEAKTLTVGRGLGRLE